MERTGEQDIEPIDPADGSTGDTAGAELTGPPARRTLGIRWRGRRSLAFRGRGRRTFRRAMWSDERVKHGVAPLG